MTGSRTSNSILIVTAGRNSFDVIKGAVRSGFSPVLYAESMAAAKQLTARENIDIIIVNTPLKDEFGTESLLDIVAQKPVSAMEIIKGDVYEQVSHKVNGSGIFVVTRPITSRGLYESVRLLTTMHGKLSELAAENRKLREQKAEKKAGRAWYRHKGEVSSDREKGLHRGRSASLPGKGSDGHIAYKERSRAADYQGSGGGYGRSKSIKEQ